jgi:dipeptidyl aminopeptidase/acylaminoacyl peptidase
MFRSVLSSRILVCVTWIAAAAMLATARTTHAITPGEALTFVRASDLRISPDGGSLAYVVQSYVSDVRARIRIIDLRKHRQRELTPQGKSERSPTWSPDSRKLYFLSNRNGVAQVYSVDVNGGSASPVTSGAQAVQRFQLSPDGLKIAYLANDKDEAADDGPQVADRESELARLWVSDLQSGTVQRLGFAGWRIDDFRWRDPNSLLIQSTSRPKVEEDTDALYSLSLQSRQLIPLATPPQPFGNISVSKDGSLFALTSTATRGPIPRDLFVGQFRDGSIMDVSARLDRTVIDYRWQTSSAIWLRLNDGFQKRLVLQRLDGQAVSLKLPYSVASFDVAPNGDLFFVGEDFTHLPEIYIRSPAGKIAQLTHLSSETKGLETPSAAIFTTPSFDGVPIEAALIKPNLAAHSPPPPLVLLVHGGPASNFTAGYGWQTAWADLLVSHGFAVLMVNPRGSDGYSESFVKANRADWGGGDYKDLVAVLDAVITRGDADPNRLGIGGWSYGGEMAAWAIGHTKRFKAAVFGAGVYDQQAEFETEDGPEGDEWYFGTPWDQPDIFARNSPSTSIRNARTPTLILSGEDDQTNPTGQSKGLYRALKHLGVETELVTYPGEDHSPRKMSNNVDIFERILAWYDAHLR